MNEEYLEVYVEKPFLAAKKRLESGEFSLIILPENGELVGRAGKGVRDLLEIFESEPTLLSGAVVLDKIIGKAAASLLILGGARAVYGETMSVHGRDFLEANGVLSAYKRLVERIENRNGDDFCPVEKVCLPAEDAMAALLNIKNFFLARQ